MIKFLLMRFRMAGRTILEIIYGQSNYASGDELIHLAEQAMIVSTRAGTTTWAVDFLPFRKMSAPLLK